MSASPAGPVLGLAFSPAAVPLLERLQQAGLLDELRQPAGREDGGEDPALWLAGRWGRARAVVAIGACGLVVRLIAPLLQGKASDPAVVVLDPEGRFVVPLLGGHGAGGEALCHRLAAVLDAQPVLTGSSGPAGRLALDSFGRAWGWRRGSGDWNALMRQAASGEGTPLAVVQEQGETGWRTLEASRSLPLQPEPDPGDPQQEALEPSLWISVRRGEGCRWHPPCLWLGIGCERDTSLAVLERLLERGLAEAGLAAEAVAGLASIDRKGDEPALLELSGRRSWPLRLFDAATLAEVAVPHPSAAVAAAMGTASVSEAAALQAAALAGGEPRLLLGKTVEKAGPGERGAATLAIACSPAQMAPARGRLDLVGSGPGSLELLTPDARRALADATAWVGYGLYLDLLEPLRRPDQLRVDGRLTAERERCAEALALARAGLPVALISSGESGIYGMAGLALELWLQLPAEERPEFTVHPGISALQLAAARAGAPLMHDFCTISLSDRLTPWEVIEQRLQAAARGDFVVALYNPRSRGRDWQLERARQILRQARPADTPVVLARQLGRPEEQVRLTSLETLPCGEVDMLTLVLVGNSTSRVQDGRMVTPRGYPGAELA
ncbi:MAG: precorrin-3B C(17)-methyltransferase [Prochlorococcaceae cyanobacterium]|jgi:cobalt-precorrin 5A hydrolase/precorrin-3B C17-methyltransferase